MEAPDLELLLASQVDMSPWLACVCYHGHHVLCMFIPLPWLPRSVTMCLLPWYIVAMVHGYHVFVSLCLC